MPVSAAGNFAGGQEQGSGCFVHGGSSNRGASALPVCQTAGRENGCRKNATALQQPEVHFHGGQDGYRVPVLLAGEEAPLLDGFNCLLVQAQAEGTDDLEVGRQALLV